MIKTKDLERLAQIREQLKKLQDEEGTIKKSILSELPAGDFVKRGHIKVTHIAYKGAPNYKAAFIEIAGEEAVDELPRPEYSRLDIRFV